jgi:hypothetical protein
MTRFLLIIAMIALALGAFAKNLFEIFLSFHGIG